MALCIEHRPSLYSSVQSSGTKCSGILPCEDGDELLEWESCPVKMEMSCWSGQMLERALPHQLQPALWTGNLVTQCCFSASNLAT